MIVAYLIANQDYTCYKCNTIIAFGEFHAKDKKGRCHVGSCPKEAKNEF